MVTSTNGENYADECRECWRRVGVERGVGKSLGQYLTRRTLLVGGLLLRQRMETGAFEELLPFELGHYIKVGAGLGGPVPVSAADEGSFSQRVEADSEVAAGEEVDEADVDFVGCQGFLIRTGDCAEE
jgi:hypothetical protein